MREMLGAVEEEPGLEVGSGSPAFVQITLGIENTRQRKLFCFILFYFI
jgi:hypothetical protein